MMIEIQDEAERRDVDSLCQVPNWVSTQIIIINSFFEDITTQPLVEYDDDKLLVDKSTYDRTTRKLNVQKAKVRGKKL